MKRIVTIVCAALMLVIMTGSAAFAGNLTVEDTYPEPGAKNTTKENMCVKVFFSNPVGNEESRKANANKFRIEDESGKEIPSVIYYDKKDEKYALIHIDTTKVPASGDDAIKDDTKYICTIDQGFRDNDGNTLLESVQIDFTTQNQGRGMMIYMIIMVVFMVLMVFFSVYQGRKQLMQDDAKAPEEPFNPYKEAKKSGKSVEEVIREHEKKEKKNGGKAADKEQEDPYRNGDRYKVKRPHPISEAGSTYKTGRKAIAEEKAKKEAEAKARRKKEGYSKKKDKKTKGGNGKKGGKK